MPEISVIIPCYNAEKTIVRALQSLEEQSFRDFEAVVVDDGSQDHSVRRIQEYAGISRMDIHLIRQENRGVSHARNAGLKQARGNLVSFLDADDVYMPDFLNVLYFQIIEKHADIAFCRYTFMDSDEELPVTNFQYEAEKTGRYDMLDIFLHKRTEHVNFCGGLYRCSLIKQHHICFPEEIKYGEDSQFFCTYVFYCEQSGVFVKKTMYRYLLQETSATRKISYEKAQNIEVYANIVSLWKRDLHFSHKTGRILIARSIWAVAKDFAIENKEFFKRLQREYQVKDAMRVMAREGDEYLIRLSSGLFLVHPSLFFFCVKLYASFYLRLDR
jgi:glycosyltransferase involved in cell wall biosynthesis